MFRKILLPVDFSPVSERAFEYARKLREAGAEKVILVHIIDENTVEAMVEGCLFKHESYRECREETERKVIENSEEKLKKLSEAFHNEIEVKIVVRIGKPACEIVKIADEENVSLILMGSHSHSPLREAFVGSVSEEVIHYTKRPVPIVR